MPILDGVLLEAKDEELLITCSDMNLSIQTRLGASVSVEGSLVLPGKLFCEVVRKLPDGELTFALSGSTATLRCMGSRTVLQGQDATNYPPLPAVEGEGLLLPQAMLRNMVQQTLFAVATDEARPILTGCLLEIDGPNLTTVALDGFRLALRTQSMDQQMPPQSVVIPSKALGEVSRILGDDGDINLVMSPTHLWCGVGSAQIITRLLEGEFIKYRQILPTEFKTRIKVDRKILQEAIDRASLMAREGKNNLVKFHMEEDMLILVSNAELGNVHEEIPILMEGPALDIAFNVRFISEALKVIEDDLIFMQFDSNVAPSVIVPETEQNEGSFLHLILPVRVHD